MLSHGLLHCINKVMQHFKGSDSPTTDTDSYDSEPCGEEEVLGVVARPC